MKIALNIYPIALASAMSFSCGLAFADDTGPSERALIADDAVSVLQPVNPASEQDKSKGFIGDSHLNLLFRSYTDHLDQEGGSATRNAWVLGNQINFTSGFTQGLVGFGADASLFSALKLNGGAGAGNMVHNDPSGGGAGRLAWSYPGIYDVKARVSNTVLKYGAQLFDTPFLGPHDNRALPPTFLGGSLISTDIKNLTIKAGSVSKTTPRGQTDLQSLSTAYGGVAFDRFSYFGGDYQFDKNTKASLHMARAEDVWDQYYAAASHSVGDVSGIKWTGAVNYYNTQNQGASKQGKIDLNTYSLELSGQHKGHTVLVGYQQNIGDQFFDYVSQGVGILITNSMDVDYNAPNEQSLQLRYKLDMGYYGIPGLSAMTWMVKGWGADASKMANAYADPSSNMHDVYWKNGGAVRGSHWEFGLVPTYVVQSGKMKDSIFQLTFMHHKAPSSYSDNTSNVYRFTMNMPVNIF